ncbi:hypothetical protein [Micromonospora sp. DH14]|uniref:effector-associated constant component EACC1 n=1 Tax=Micromonospora sp. DH14 TaxID=3040120 RepID=UPI0024426CCC|nr:hypothetical protein [Micromonospora sp. DH14]MDG9673929.1 hypothetical protein [Micromonospora sp. DH14]
MATVRVTFDVAGLPSHHSAVSAALAEFDADLRSAAVLRAAAQEVPAGTPGTKGQWGDLVVTLTGPAVLAAAVRVFHLWLSRDKRRSITVTTVVAGGDGEQRSTTTIEGENVSDETVRQALERFE